MQYYFPHKTYINRNLTNFPISFFIGDERDFNYLSLSLFLSLPPLSLSLMRARWDTRSNNPMHTQKKGRRIKNYSEKPTKTMMFWLF